MTKVITYGTFDLFHEGHYRLLERAKALGDYLIVGVTTETYDKRRGKLNVVDSLSVRIENVRKTGFADEIVIEEEVGQKIRDIQRYGVDIFTVGSDWEGKFDYINKYCKVVYLERTKNISSTMLRVENHKIIRLGVIGTGRIANRFMHEQTLVSGIEAQAVYNPHPNSAEAFAKKHELDSFSDLDSFYGAVDAVYIASPHETHYEYAKKSLEAGKHVLCEKPLVFSKEEASELFSIAKEKGLILFEGIKTAYCPGFMQLLNVAQSNVIGEVRYVDACFTKLEKPDSRELNDLKYGGSMTELGSYVLLPAIKLFGTEYDDIHFECIKDEKGLDIFTKTSMRFGRGLATVTCGLGVKSEGRLLIGGTKGYIVAEAPWWKTKYFEVHYENSYEVDKYADRFLGDGLRYEISDFLRMINGEEGISFKLTREDSISMAGVMREFLDKERKG